MNGIRWMLLCAVLLGPGCLSLPQFQATKPAAAPAPASVVQAPPAPSVLPEQVNDANGRDMAAALARELDQAAAEPPKSAPVVDGKAPK